VNPTDTPSEILTTLNEFAGFDPDEEIQIYEVGLCFRIYFYLLCNFIKLKLGSLFLHAHKPYTLLLSLG
jgi:hypothetical protein